MSFLVFLLFASSVVAWFSSTMQNWHLDLHRAGLLPAHWSAKASLAGALIGAFTCAMSSVPLGIVGNVAVVATGASLACGSYVAMMATLHGLDSQLAEAMRYHRDLASKVLTERELGDPVRLQAYLDKAYGKGRVSAKDLMAERKRSKDEGDSAAQPA
jgi:hypothetical protein